MKSQWGKGKPMHINSAYQSFIPDPASVRSEYRLKEIIIEFGREYQRNCAKVGNKTLSDIENTRLVSESKDRLL